MEMSEGKNIVLVATGYSRRELSEIKDKIGRCVILSSIGDGPIIGTMEKLLQEGYQVVSTETIEPSGDKNKLVVAEDLDRMILREQLKALGIEIEVVVDSDSVSSMVNGLLALPSTHEEMKKILGHTPYEGNYERDCHQLLGQIKEAFRLFMMRHPKNEALRDLTIGRLGKELTERAPSSDVKDSAKEASVTVTVGEGVKSEDLLFEILKEVKGFRESVQSPSADDRRHHAIREFVSSSQLSVEAIINGLRAIEAGTTEQAGSDHLSRALAKERITKAINGGLKHVGNGKNFIEALADALLGDEKQETRYPTTKEEFVSLLTEAVGDVGAARVLPPISLDRMTANTREQVVKLLNPTFSAVFHGHYNAHIQTFSTEQIFKALVEALDGDDSVVNFYGLNTLGVSDKATLRHELSRALGIERIKVVGSNKQSFLEGLINALQEDKTIDTHIVVNGLGNMTEADGVELVNILKQGLGDSVFVGHQARTENILRKLLEAVSGNEINQVTLHDLKYIDSRAKRNLCTALKVGLTKFEELEQRDKNFAINGAETEKKPNVNLTLGKLVHEWKQAAAEKGIEINEMELLNHLLQQVIAQHSPMYRLEGGKWVERVVPLARPLDWSVVTQNIPEQVTTAIVFGNHTFDCTKREDGSVKVTTNHGDNKSSNLIITKDGSVKFEDPGYLG